jgi:phosphoribosylpyrophosphate synthetase
MVLQYSNQETSVTIGESVRDEDGMRATPQHHRAAYLERLRTDLKAYSIRPTINPTE